MFVYMLSIGNHGIGLSVIYYFHLHQLCGFILIIVLFNLLLSN